MDGIVWDMASGLPALASSRDTQLPAAACGPPTHAGVTGVAGRAGEKWTILADRPRLTGLDGGRSCHLLKGWLLREQRQGQRLEEGQPDAESTEISLTFLCCS